MSWWLDITDLDDDQKDVIELPPEGNYLILGPPGSGKTNLLLIRAEYLIRTGRPNTVVLMFNDPLHDFVVRGGAHYEVPSAKIRKLLSWEIMLLREHSVTVDDFPEDDLPAKRKMLALRVHDLLNGNRTLEKHLQCLFVDEVQDCCPEEMELFFRCAERVCCAGDEGQRMFSSASVVPALEKREGVRTIRLKTHYRIGHQICRVADAVGRSAGIDAVEGNCNYRDAADKVEFVQCGDVAEQLKRITESLKVQLTAYPDELLGVAAPRIRDRDVLREHLESSELAAFLLPHRQSGSDDGNQRIYVAHLGEIKGLEFRTIHLAFMEHLHRLGANQKRIAYTAITRAKTTVSLYFAGRIPGYLEQAQVIIEPPRRRPPLSDLFPKGKKRDT